MSGQTPLETTTFVEHCKAIRESASPDFPQKRSSRSETKSCLLIRISREAYNRTIEPEPVLQPTIAGKLAYRYAPQPADQQPPRPFDPEATRPFDPEAPTPVQRTQLFLLWLYGCSGVDKYGPFGSSTPGAPSPPTVVLSDASGISGETRLCERRAKCRCGRVHEAGKRLMTRKEKAKRGVVEPEPWERSWAYTLAGQDVPLPPASPVAPSHVDPGVQGRRRSNTQSGSPLPHRSVRQRRRLDEICPYLRPAAAIDRSNCADQNRVLPPRYRRMLNARPQTVPTPTAAPDVTQSRALPPRYRRMLDACTQPMPTATTAYPRRARSEPIPEDLQLLLPAPAPTPLVVPPRASAAPKLTIRLPSCCTPEPRTRGVRKAGKRSRPNPEAPPRRGSRTCKGRGPKFFAQFR